MKLKRLISAITSLIIVLSSSGYCLTANAQTDAEKNDEQSSSTTETYLFDDYEMTVGEILYLPVGKMYNGNKGYEYIIEDNNIAGFGSNGQANTNYMVFLHTLIAKNVGETTCNVVDMTDNSVVATRKIKVNPVKSVDIQLQDPEIKVNSVNGVVEGIVSIKSSDDILYHYTNDELMMIDSNVRDSYIFLTQNGNCKEYIWHKDGILTLNGVNAFDNDVLVNDFSFDKKTSNLYVVTNDGTLWKTDIFDNMKLKAINEDCDRFAGYGMYYRKDGMLCHEKTGWEIGKINMVDFCGGIDQIGDRISLCGEFILDDEGKVWLVEDNSYNGEGKSSYTLTLVSDEVSKIGRMIMNDNFKISVYVKTDGKIYSLQDGREMNYDGKIYSEEFGYLNSGLLYKGSISYQDVNATIFDDKTANVKYKNEGIKITDVEDVFGCQTSALILRTDGTLWRYAGGDTVSQVNFDSSQNNEKSFVYGDVTGDRSVDLLDLIQISMYLLRDVKFNEDQIKAVDFDESGEVDITELATVRQYIMKDKITLGPKK